MRTPTKKRSGNTPEVPPASSFAQARCLMQGPLLAIPSTVLATLGAAGMVQSAGAWATGGFALGLAGLISGCVITVRSGMRWGGHAAALTGVLGDTVRGTGDLTRRLPIESTGPTGRLAGQVNTFLDRVNQIIWLTVTASQTLGATSERLSSASGGVAAATQQVTDAIGATAAGVSEQAHTVARGAEEVQQLSRYAETVSSNVQSAAKAAAQAAELADKGAHDLRRADAKMAAIQESVSETAEVDPKFRTGG